MSKYQNVQYGRTHFIPKNATKWQENLRFIKYQKNGISLKVAKSIIKKFAGDETENIFPGNYSDK